MKNLEEVFMLYLFIEDIVANALIELNKLDGSRTISLASARRYGNELIKKLKEQGYYTKLKANEEFFITQFEKKYADYFVGYYVGEEKIYSLNEDKTIEDLIVRFRKPIPEEIVDFFMSVDVIGVFQTSVISDPVSMVQTSSDQSLAIGLDSNEAICLKEDRCISNGLMEKAVNLLEEQKKLRLIRRKND